MAFNFGQISEFTDSNSAANPVIAALAKAITLPRFKGAVYGRMGAPTVGIKTKQYDVYSRSKNTRNGVIGTAAVGDWGGTAPTTALPVPAGSNVGLTVGHVIKVDSEIMVVKSVNRSANTIDVFARGAAGTTAATHTTGAAFTVIGFAGRDVDLKNAESVTEGSLKCPNYIQTIYEMLDWTKGAELERQGLSTDNVVALLRQEAGIRVAEMLSNMAVNGVKQSGSASIPFMTSGLLASLEDTNGSTRPINRYNASSAAIDETMHGRVEVVVLGTTDLGGRGRASVRNPVNAVRAKTKEKEPAPAAAPAPVPVPVPSAAAAPVAGPGAAMSAAVAATAPALLPREAPAPAASLFAMPASSPAAGSSHKGAAEGPVAQNEFTFGEQESRGHFENTDRNLFEGQDLDVPTYLRKGIKLAF